MQPSAATNATNTTAKPGVQLLMVASATCPAPSYQKRFSKLGFGCGSLIKDIRGLTLPAAARQRLAMIEKA